MDGVGKAIMVGSYYGSKSTGVKLNVLVDSSRNALLSTGDFTSQIAKDDSVQIGSCKDLFVFSLRYEAFNTTRYRDSPTSWETRVKGYTVFKITRIPGLNSIPIDFAAECFQIEMMLSTALVGSFVRSKLSLKSKARLKPAFTITNAVHGSTNVTIKPGTTASLLPGLKLSIAGLTYEVGTSNDTCSVTCITFSTDYKGPNVLDANTHIPGFYNQEIYAITTSDLLSILSESLGVEVQIGNDFFEVKGVSNSSLILSGKVTTSSDTSHSIYVDGNGAEQSIIMKTFTSDLDTFQVIPNSNWRGTN